MMMLSLKPADGVLIAISETDPNLKLYMTPDKDDTDVDTSLENKIKIFTNYLKTDKKTSIKDIREMTESFKEGLETHPNPKLDRKYENATAFVYDSLKHFLQYPASTKLFPVVQRTKPYTIYITGMRGSGKTYFVKQFLKLNRDKSRPVVFISPFPDDESMKGLKDILPFDPDEIEQELGRPVTIEDFPEKAIIVFDDLEGFPKKKMVRLDDLRDKALTMGRHLGLSVISICHNPMEGNRTRTAIRESQYYVLFPQSNPRDISVLLSTYAGYSNSMINEIIQSGSRFVFVNKSAPRYWISSSKVRIL
ncbi:MAG: hypothetical protein EBW68_00870 [Actinobacteria bacterium]|nr:hypothetical protein [Actinomycetota bacterium]